MTSLTSILIFFTIDILITPILIIKNNFFLTLEYPFPIITSIIREIKELNFEALIKQIISQKYNKFLFQRYTRDPQR